MIQEANMHWRYVDTESNLIMPWYVLPALEWLKKHDVSKWIVFEYGAGYSTVWWRLNAKHIFSVENNFEWARALGADFEDMKEKYVKKIEFLSTPMGTLATGMIFELTPEEKNNNLSDCIIVDGEWREECVEFSRAFLKPGGFMIVDNYGQEDFPPTEKIDALLVGWHKQVFKQPNHTSWKTAVFQKPA